MESRVVYQFRGKLYSKYQTETALARHLKWSKQRLNRITNGYKEPTLDEIYALSEALGCSFCELAEIFLSHWSPNRLQ